MITTIAIGAVAGTGALLAFAARRPDTFRIERATRVNAPPDAIFPLIADFHRWEAWSPYEKLDPAMKRTHSGAENGEGAVYAWESEGKPGAGRMEIKGATPSKIAIQLDFIKPFQATNRAEFTLTPYGDATRVTWAMTGSSNFGSKLMGIFLDFDRLVGKDFEKGLADLKRAAEAAEA